MSFLDQIFTKKGRIKDPAVPTPPLSISMDTFHRFKDRLLEQYQKDPMFHAIVDNFYASMQDGSITSEALFDALFLAKEILILNHEDRIRDNKTYSKEKL